MFHRLIVLSLFAVALLAGPALGQKPTVSQEEQLRQLLQRFPDADANRDGTLTREEAQAYRAKMRGKDGKQPSRKQPAPPVKPTHADVHYGPHERQVLDFYQAKSSQPSPVIVYIHGGGFVAGDKRSVNPAMLQDALDAGISFAAIHYRCSTTGPGRSSSSAARPRSGMSTRRASPATAVPPGRVFRCGSAFTTTSPSPTAPTPWHASLHASGPSAPWADKAPTIPSRSSS